MSQELKELRISDIWVDEEFNCRGTLMPADVVDLARDIERNSLINPVSVMPLPNDHDSGYKYKLIAGFCRTKAHEVLGRKTIPAIIQPRMDDIRAALFNLNENDKRKALNIMQEANAIRHLRDLGLTEEQLMEETGRTRGWIQPRVMLLKMPEAVQKMAISGDVLQTHVRDLYSEYIHSGNDDDHVIKLARDVKLSRQRGHKNARVKLQVKKDTKKLRKKTEIFTMMSHIQRQTGPNLATAALAWAAGEISEEDFHDRAEKIFEKHDKPYSREVVEDDTML